MRDSIHELCKSEHNKLMVSFSIQSYMSMFTETVWKIVVCLEMNVAPSTS